jgi:hypothetical protein
MSFIFNIPLLCGPWLRRRYGAEDVGLKTKRNRCLIPDGATKLYVHTKHLLWLWSRFVSILIGYVEFIPQQNSSWGATWRSRHLVSRIGMSGVTHLLQYMTVWRG